MQIANIINLMALMGVGIDTPSQYDSAIYLKYLNQAHYELYNYTAALNDDLFINETPQTDANNTDVELDNIPLVVSEVWIKDTRKLHQLSLQDFVSYKNSHSANVPRVFMFKKNVLSIYPIMSGVQYDLDIWYIPQPSELKETTAEDDIPYPVAYHPTLVDGALYYLFQDEGGFRNTDKSLIHQKNGKMEKLFCKAIYSIAQIKPSQLIAMSDNVCRIRL